MRKQLAFVLAMTAAMTLLIANPASAVNGNPYIGWCSGGCWLLRGMAADVRVANWVINDCGGGHVDSMYFEPQLDTFPSIEFGWVQAKSPWPICGYGDREMFMLAYDSAGNKVTDVSFNINNYGTGNFRLLMYQNVSSPGIVRFAFDDPTGHRYILNTTISMSAIQGWGANFVVPAITSIEIRDETRTSVAQSALPYHRNIWVMNSEYNWFPANGTRGMVCTNDTLNLWTTSEVSGSGSVGDHLPYQKTAGYC